MEKGSQLLMLAYYFPPIKSIGVVRNFHIANQFSESLSAVQVITTSNCDVLPAEKIEIPKSIKVTKVFTFDYRSFFAFRSKKENPHFTEEQKANWFSQFFVKLLRSFPFNLVIGEGGFFYILNGVIKGAKTIRQSAFRTILYSSFPTYSDHAIALILKRIFPKSFWIADFRDLHTDPIYDIVFNKGFQHWCNKRMLRRADLVTTISQGLADQLSKYHDQVHVLRNGVSLEKVVETEKYAKFTIAYTGSLFTDERDPRPLLKAMQELIADDLIDADKFQLQYAGKDGTKMQAWVTENGLLSVFQNKGLLSHKEAIEIQHRTHINLLLTSSHQDMSGVLTGKLFEYLSAQNPILLLIKGTKDKEFEAIFKKVNAGFIAYHNTDGDQRLKKYLLAAYQDWEQNGQLSHQINTAELFASFSWEKSIKDLLKKMEEVENAV